MSKKVKVMLWTIVACLGVPFLLFNFYYMYTYKNNCYGKSIFYNIYHAYKYELSSPGGAKPGTYDCPLPSHLREEPLYTSNTL